jgi:ABC-type lipoprotein export system ATPase subunit
MTGGSGAEVIVEAVSKRYGNVQALADIDLHVASGEVLLVTGHSGSGKSTLLNLIGGLDQPDTGQILIDGETVWQGDRITEYRREVTGFVFQHHLLLPTLTAQANVEVPLIGAGVRRIERRARALALLDEVGLHDRSDHLPTELSGGERQRVAVARALANEPRLLLADEPTGALDTGTSDLVLDLLLGVHERRGTTLVIVSYDPGVGERADRTVWVVDGRLQTQAPVASLAAGGG